MNKVYLVLFILSVSTSMLIFVGAILNEWPYHIHALMPKEGEKKETTKAKKKGRKEREAE